MRVRVLTICAAVAIGAMAPASCRAVHSAQAGATPRVERWPSLGIAISELVLDNGFRILLVEDHHVPRVAASLWYRFGGLQEQNGEHGAAHFLEHAMHQGTTTVGIKDWAADRKIWNEIWSTEQQLLAERNAHRNMLRERNIFFNEGDWPATEEETRLRKRLYDLEDQQAKNRVFWEEYNWYRRNGGIMRHGDPVPANTGNELLRIEVDLPKERLEMFFRLEADRMVNAVFRGWEAQRFTVLEQFYVLQRHETGRFQEALNNVTGGPHPIFNHPGGHERDFAYFNRASMLRMYDDFIVPNNATLVLVGDMTIDQVRPIAAKYFGRLARAPEPPAQMDVEVDPPPGGSVRFDWMEPLEPQVIVRYRIPGVGHRDRPAFDVIARVLRGPDGVLAQSQGGRAGGEWTANASQNGSPNTLSMQSSAARDEDLPSLEAVAGDAVERLRRGEVDQERLARIKRDLRLDWEIVRSDRGSLASQIGGFMVADDWRTMKAYYEARDAVTVADLRRVSEKYLVPWNRVTATTRRNPQPPAEGTTTSAIASDRPREGGR